MTHVSRVGDALIQQEQVFPTDGELDHKYENLLLLRLQKCNLPIDTCANDDGKTQTEIAGAVAYCNLAGRAGLRLLTRHRLLALSRRLGASHKRTGESHAAGRKQALRHAGHRS